MQPVESGINKSYVIRICLGLLAGAALAAAQQADTQPLPLPAEITVQGNAYITAGIIPPHVARNLFGKAVSNSFAVVQVIVSNRSDEASLVLHGLSIDYSRWVLGACPPTRRSGKGNPLDSHQVASRPCEVSTVEVRAVRQIAQDGQLSSWRNQVLRYLKGIGDIGGGLTIAAGLGPVLPKAVSGYTTGGVTAFEFAFPDKTINQINLINDTAFAVNTVVPKQSSAMVFAFFPIERFLGSFLMKYFIKDTALFFSPMSFLMDPHYERFFQALVTHYAKPKQDGTIDARLNLHQNPELKRILAEVTLNHMTVIAEGVYVVNVEDVAADASSVVFDGKDEDNFAGAGDVTVTGRINGRLMTGAAPVLQDSDKLGITVAKVDDGSDEKMLQIKLTATKPVPEQRLFFTVKKQKQGAADLVSNPVTYMIHYPFQGAPTITDGPATAKVGDSIELTGKNIFDSKDPAKHLSAVLRQNGASGAEVSVPDDHLVWASQTKVTIRLPGAVTAGDWQIILKSGTAPGTVRDIKIQ